jgi:hypothetical protein
VAYIRTFPLPNSAILRLNSEKDRINVQPWYQRRGEVWTREKRQLLIDSILNDYDIPKLYFHSLTPGQRSEYGNFDYAIVDGRQRLEAIWGFADDGFPLSEDFYYLADPRVKAAGLTYSQLGSAYPKLKIRFDSFTVPVICVETDDIDLIEDMFARLNEAVPLNAAEKRNAIGGPMAECVRTVSGHHFFASRVRFADTRYQHREAAARLLFIEYAILFHQRIIDTKKPYLDDMVRKYKAGKATRLDEVRNRTTTTLNLLDASFVERDALLRSQASIPVFYLTMRTAAAIGEAAKFTRDKIEQFQIALESNRDAASKDMASANFDFLEYDRMNQQGTNDAPSIRERTRILCEYLGISVPKDWPQQ